MPVYGSYCTKTVPLGNGPVSSCLRGHHTYTPETMQMELEAANKLDMTIHGMCSLELSVHGLVIHKDTVVVDLNCQAILEMDILGDATKLPFILDLVDGTLSGGGYETIQLHRFHAATECFAETTDTVCIPPHSEVMLWAKLKTNNGQEGPQRESYSRYRHSYKSLEY